MCVMFCVITEDRHFDTRVEVFEDRGDAIDYARKQAKSLCRHQEYYEESEVEGWIFSATYSADGDHVFVVEKVGFHSK